MRGRNVVLLAISASALSWLTLFLNHREGLLYLSYALGGVSSGLFEPIGNSLIAKGSSIKKRGTAIGNFAALCGIDNAVTGMEQATSAAYCKRAFFSDFRGTRFAKGDPINIKGGIATDNNCWKIYCNPKKQKNS